MTTNTTPKPKPKAPKPIDHTSQPYTGQLTFDVSSVGPILVDLPAGGMRGLLHEKPGIEDVIAELANAVPNAGTAAGVPAAAYQSFLTATANLEKLAGMSTAIAKIAEVFVESVAFYDNERELAVALIIDTVKATAKRKKSAALAAPFQTTIAYAAQSAVKGAKTKKKNVAAKAAAATTPATPAAPAAAPVPAQSGTALKPTGT